MNTYFQQVNRYLTMVAQQESNQLMHIAKQIVKRLTKGGIIQLFGSGHSMLLAQECYYRAGGLVPVKPIHIESLMLHQGARQSSQNEKKQAFLATYKVSCNLMTKMFVSSFQPLPIIQCPLIWLSMQRKRAL